MVGVHGKGGVNTSLHRLSSGPKKKKEEKCHQISPDN
jgi:hypothetical protein